VVSESSSLGSFLVPGLALRLLLFIRRGAFGALFFGHVRFFGLRGCGGFLIFVGVQWERGAAKRSDGQAIKVDLYFMVKYWCPEKNSQI